MNFKEAYIIELEHEMLELEEAGVPSHRAYELASVRAYDRMAERLADMGDNLKTLRDEGEG